MRARIVTVVLPCTACHATYEIVMALVTAPRELSRWRYELPDCCSHCAEPLSTPTQHVHVRNTAANLLIAGMHGDAA